MRRISRRHMRSLWAKRASAVIIAVEAILGDLCDRVDSLLDDPMTHAMGAPTGEFIEDWTGAARRKSRPLIRELRKMGVPVGNYVF